MCATPRPATRVRDRCHAHATRTRTGTDRVHRHQVTDRPYTGLTATFSRPTESRSEPRTASEGVHARPLMRSAVSHYLQAPPGSPFRPRGRWGGICTHLASLGRRPEPAADFGTLRVNLQRGPCTRVRRRPPHAANASEWLSAVQDPRRGIPKHASPA